MPSITSMSEPDPRRQNSRVYRFLVYSSAANGLTLLSATAPSLGAGETAPSTFLSSVFDAIVVAKAA